MLRQGNRSHTMSEAKRASPEISWAWCFCSLSIIIACSLRRLSYDDLAAGGVEVEVCMLAISKFWLSAYGRTDQCGCDQD